ncbi:Isy1-like splicing factor [Exidia glandulosa HHB12029]|uniref:Isy1-like splicing factor n=1 Tax=Exidia glandulosa HHB12029 TaxID=1314781 RepID=A0A165HS21_EXIGL|nr:Isy1-like splicing factor [Exidia glandulosa HHB12029]
MLYRFREAQAAELGLGTRADRRPRMASSCKNMRECERWRGEILREVSRKVAKIQDAGLGDYEIRDLNDEINKLMREKRHWENQIIALGGTNYRRNVAMVDDDGKEVPGTKGYKYFGRARDLPGVRELFQSKKKEHDEENAALMHYKKFMDQGPAYFGDLDEQNQELLPFERQLEEEDWEEAYMNLRAVLGLPTDEPIPPYPHGARPPVGVTSSASAGGGKRKAPDEDDAATPSAPAPAPPDPSKRSKTGATTDGAEEATPYACAAAFIPFLSPEELAPPKLPTREDMEDALLALRKRGLLEEYFGEDGALAH